jgi:hypothetical protein
LSDFPPFFHVNHAIFRRCEVRAAAVSGLGVMGVAARGFQDEATEETHHFPKGKLSWHGLA